MWWMVWSYACGTLSAVSDTLRNISSGQLAVLIPKGIQQFPENNEKMKGTIDIWWIVRILGCCAMCYVALLLCSIICKSLFHLCIEKHDAQESVLWLHRQSTCDIRRWVLHVVKWSFVGSTSYHSVRAEYKQKCWMQASELHRMDLNSKICQQLKSVWPYACCLHCVFLP